MKNKKNILLSIGLILFILLGFFSYNSYKNIQEKKIAFELKKLEDEKKLEEEQKINEEISEKLVDMEISPTLNIEIEDESSISTNSEQVVDTKSQISEEELKKRKEKVLILTYSNVEQCDKLVYYKEECKEKFIFNLAVNQGDLKYCDKISDEIERNDCKDDIYYKNNNCKQIKNSFLREKCENNNLELKQELDNQKILNSVSKESDTKKCNVFDNFYEKQLCLKNIILSTTNIDICKSFYEDFTEQNNCIKDVSYDYTRKIINEAFTKKDLSICDKLLDENSKKQCKSMTF